MNEVIKKLRNRKGITQKQLADHMGLKQSTISRIENGMVNVNLNTIIKIFLFLKASKNEINNYLDKVSTDNCYNFFSMVVQDKNIISNINNDPLLCFDKFKASIS